MSHPFKRIFNQDIEDVKGLISRAFWYEETLDSSESVFEEGLYALGVLQGLVTAIWFIHDNAHYGMNAAIQDMGIGRKIVAAIDRVIESETEELDSEEFTVLTSFKHTVQDVFASVE